MCVFISYSVADLSLVRQIADRIRPSAEPIFWDQDKDPGSPPWGTIASLIDSADVVLGLITDKVMARGAAVNQEIGYAKAKGKTIVPLIASNVPKSDTGFLNSITWIEFDGTNPGLAVDKVLGKITALNETRRQQDAQREADQVLLACVLGAIVLFAVAGSKK